MPEKVFDRLVDLLNEHNVPFDTMRHEAVFTSEQAAAVRGTSLSSGAKALVCKADGRFLMFVLPADRRLASKHVRADHGIKSLRFAAREEVLELTGLAPGSIPPFGSLFKLPTWCDERLAEEATINFNAGDHSISISMSFEAYVVAEHPTMGHFAE